MNKKKIKNHKRYIKTTTKFDETFCPTSPTIFCEWNEIKAIFEQWSGNIHKDKMYSSPPTYAINVSSKNIALVEIAQLGVCFM